MKDHLESSIFGDRDDRRRRVEDPVDSVDHVERADRRDQFEQGDQFEQVGYLHSEHAEQGEQGEQGVESVEFVERADRPRRPPRGGGRSHGSSMPSRLRRTVVILVALAVMVGGAGVALNALRPMFSGFGGAAAQPIDFAGPGTGSVKVKVPQGSGGSAIASLLVSQGVIKSRQAFIEAATADRRSAGIQPGVYTLRKQMTAADALAMLVEPSNRVITRVTVPEGLWAAEVYAKLSQQTGIPVAQYAAAAKNGKALGLPSSAKGNVEGYLFPASYEFDPESTAADQLKQMVGETMKRLKALEIPPAEMERVLILASLVEGEARTEADRGKVARVIENRLDDGEILGMDSTVNYIFKKRGVPTVEMLDSNSAYNTRKFGGLPPGPISNPGESAIKAAANPPKADWYYFTTVNLCTGETKFAETASEHQRNVEEFNTWRQTTGGKC